jgi:signal transduction histidine kinase
MTPTRREDAELVATPPPFVTLGSGRTISKSSLFTTLQVGGWAAAFLVCAIAAEPQQGLWPSLFDTLVWACCGFLITLGAHYLYRSLRRRRYSHPVIAAMALVASVCFAPLWYFLEHIALRAAQPALLQVSSLRAVFAADAALMARQPLLLTQYLWPFYSVILFTWASLYFGVNAILELESERANVVTALKLAERARLRSLQSNLNPHFLFNALNGIATLVREGDTATAVAMVDALSLFLRSTLQRVDTPELRVEEELELIEQYFRVQRYRFGARLHATVEAEPGARTALVPTLILQPLVENAVRYSVLPREAGGSLWVTVRKDHADLAVSVEDDGPGLKGGALNAFGLGLQNSADRLKALYGASASLTISNRADGTGCAVLIRLPFRLAPSHQADDPKLESAHA